MRAGSVPATALGATAIGSVGCHGNRVKREQNEAMTMCAWTPVGLCRVLEEDGELLEALPAAVRERATRECICRGVSVRAGQWAPPRAGSGSGIGLLVLGGLLVRRVGVDERVGAELLGSGDLLRPWDPDGESHPTALAMANGWQVLETTRLAVLDEAFAARLSRYPQLTGTFVARALRRSRELALNMAIVNHSRVDVRVHMLLWHLAGRWGRVSREGVVLTLRLTHEVLADLVAARRPTVTSALSSLAKRKLVTPLDRGWLLSGGPPGELVELAPLRMGLAAEAAATHAQAAL